MSDLDRSQDVNAKDRMNLDREVKHVGQNADNVNSVDTLSDWSINSKLATDIRLIFENRCSTDA